MHASGQESGYSIIGGRARRRVGVASIPTSFSPRVVTPVEELFYRARVRQARVAVTNRRTKEFDEAAAGPLADDADNRRQRLKPGTDQCRRRLLFRRRAQSCDGFDIH